MNKAILKDKILKLIIENVDVTRADQISGILNINDDTALSLLKEMEESEHIRLLRIGSRGVYVIILKTPGWQFYKSLGHTGPEKEITENERMDDGSSSKINRKVVIWITIGILAAILIAVITGYKKGWFS